MSLLRRSILGRPKHIYLRALTDVFRVETLSPYIFVLPTVVTMDYDVVVLDGANNNQMTIVGRGGSSPTAFFQNSSGLDPSVGIPESNFTSASISATGVGDLRGKRESHIQVTLGTSGLMNIYIDGELKNTINGPSQTGATFNFLFWRNGMTSLFLNPNILIRNLKISTSGGITIDMPLEGNFNNSGSAPISTITGVEDVDYKFIKA